MIPVEWWLQNTVNRSSGPVFSMQAGPLMALPAGKAISKALKKRLLLSSDPAPILDPPIADQIEMLKIRLFKMHLTWATYCGFLENKNFVGSKTIIGRAHVCLLPDP